MATIREVLSECPGRGWHVPPEATVLEVLQVMTTRDIGAVPIVEGGQLVGIVSERDCATHIVQAQRSARDTAVRELMSTPVPFVGHEQSIEDCMAMMTQRHLRHLPVLDGKELVGIVSLRDIMRHLISGRDQAIEQLEHYITGTG